MYILTFKSARSKYFPRGLKLAIRLGGTWDGESMVLKIPESRLLTSYKELLPLFEIVRNWSSLRATFRGQQVHPIHFILVMHYISDCAVKRRADPLHCRMYTEERGWGCKRLSRVQYHVFGDGKYRLNERFWYNFGHFNEKNEWVIDKKALFRRLYRHAESRGLILCPFFDAAKLEKALDDLPGIIVPDGKAYRVHYEFEYCRGDKVKVPVNIRHIQDSPDRFLQSQGGTGGRYNAHAIQAIDHHGGNRFIKPGACPDLFWFSKN